MRAYISIAGIDYPLAQVTVRRSADAASIDFQIAGRNSLPALAAVVLSVDGFSNITGTLSESAPSDRITTGRASVTPATGAGAFEPGPILFRSSGTIRTAVDFDVLPGDTYFGMAIADVTSTIGASSSWFTEVRF
jgi:hypothetical protein